jgi:hypothetical protein
MAVSNHLGDHFKAGREALALSRGQLAHLLGYKNVGKGARRIDVLERCGYAPTGFPESVGRVLGIAPGTVADLTARDREEFVRAWEAWADEPVPIQVVIRCIPGVFGRHALPADVNTPEAAVSYGQALAKRIGKMVFVVLSRRLSVTIGEDGAVRSENVATSDRDITPFMMAGRHKFVLPFGPTGEAETHPYL